MKIDDNELKRLLQEGMEYEADLIMKEVESNPDIQDVIAPEDIHVNLMKQIQEHKEAEEKEKAEQEKEEQELIRLGKKYKKKLSRRKYIILIAAIVCAFAVGSVSFGDGKKVFSEMKRKLGDREQTVVNTPSERHAVVDEIASEEEAYEQINEKLGVYPVKLIYLSEGMQLADSSINEDLQIAQLHYDGVSGKNILYRISTDYREGSSSIDIEDIFIREYEKKLEKVNVIIKEYEIEENKSTRWSANFVYKDAQYTLILTEISQQEVEKILENLVF